MTTINIKHSMLKLAKSIANKEYQPKREILRGLDGSICGGSYYPASYFEELDIKDILGNHPEFDPNEFKKMIRKIKRDRKTDE